MKSIITIMLIAIALSSCEKEEKLSDSSEAVISDINTKLDVGVEYTFRSKIGATCSSDTSTSKLKLKLQSNGTLQVVKQIVSVSANDKLKSFNTEPQLTTSIDSTVTVSIPTTGKYWIIPFNNTGSLFKVTAGGTIIYECLCATEGGNCAVSVTTTNGIQEVTCVQTTCEDCCDMTVYTDGTMLVSNDGSILVRANKIEYNGTIYQ